MAGECSVDVDVLLASNTQWSLDSIISQTIREVEYQTLVNIEVELKSKMTRKFINSFSKDKTGKSLFDEINKNIKDLRNFGHFPAHYSRGLFSDDNFLAVLFFLDGCTILQFIRSYLRMELEEFEIGIVKRRWIRDKLFARDFCQIPFRVLELLVNLSNDPYKLKIDIVRFIHINNITKNNTTPIIISPSNCLRQWNDIIQIKIQDLRVDFHHLLYSLITSVDGDIVSTNNNRDSEENIHGNVLCVPCFCRQRPKPDDPVAIGYDIIDNNGSIGYDIIDNNGFFRNVQELKSAGIEFKPSGRSLADISFSGKCFNLKGHLELPPLIVDEKTQLKLEELLVYELDIDDKRNVVTSYVKFMDILIDNEQDVKELRASRVLQNRLSSDKEVADWFNKLGSKFNEPPVDYFSDVKIKIQAHCERRCAIWMNQVYLQYFSNPWAIIGLIAAVMVLSLTAVQTWYAVNPKK